jgi:hypothetical protein
LVVVVVEVEDTVELIVVKVMVKAVEAIGENTVEFCSDNNSLYK